MTKRKDQVLRDLIRKIKKVFKASFFDTMSSQQSKTESLNELASSLASYVSLKISECDWEQIAFSLGMIVGLLYWNRQFDFS